MKNHNISNIMRPLTILASMTMLPLAVTLLYKNFPIFAQNFKDKHLHFYYFLNIKDFPVIHQTFFHPPSTSFSQGLILVLYYIRNIKVKFTSSLNKCDKVKLNLQVDSTKWFTCRSITTTINKA